MLARVNFLIATIDHRKARLEEAEAFAGAVPPESSVFLEGAVLLLGIIWKRRPALHPRRQDALQQVDQLIRGRHRQQGGLGQKDDVLTKQLALLGLGRVYYGIGQYDRSSAAYERVPRFSKYWDQALFENGFARFQDDDLGGGLGSLQALHAPQFAGAFQPESWVLKATIYYFSCLYAESKTALSAFDELYLPMAEKLKPLVDVDNNDRQDVREYFHLVDTTDSEKVPKAVLNYVRSNERMLGVFSMLKEIDREKKKLEDNSGWRSSKLSGEVTTYLDVNKDVLQKVAGQLAKNRLVEAYKSIKGFADNAEIIRFEDVEGREGIGRGGCRSEERAGVAEDLPPGDALRELELLGSFQGEFWRDEIGYYQYTLKRGCPGGAE